MVSGLQIEDATDSELEWLAGRIEEELGRRRTKLEEEKTDRKVVETRQGSRGRWLRLEFVKCGKWGRCNKCRSGEGHGPYFYLYYANPKTGRRTSKYIGKPQNISPELIQEFGL